MNNCYKVKPIRPYTHANHTKRQQQIMQNILNVTNRLCKTYQMRQTNYATSVSNYFYKKLLECIKWLVAFSFTNRHPLGQLCLPLETQIRPSVDPRVRSSGFRSWLDPARPSAEDGRTYFKGNWSVLSTVCPALGMTLRRRLRFQPSVCGSS